MFRSDRCRLWLAVVLGFGLSVGVALACGPDFPYRLLEHRARSMSELPDSIFRVEIRQLGAPIAGLAKAGEGTVIASPQPDEDGIGFYLRDRDAIEQAQLPAPQWQRVQQLRKLHDVAQFEAAATGLPAELALYSAGAVAYQNMHYALASRYFQRVLDLPAEQRRLRSTWAAYSLARAQINLVTPAANVAATHALQLTRRLSIDGFSDPLELGIASLGEEARLAKNEGDWSRAIQLYASQYQQGAIGGFASLRFVSAELAGLPEATLAPLLQQAEVRQLLTIRLLSRIDTDAFDGTPSDADQALSKTLTGHGGIDPHHADYLAALSYQAGRYGEAQAFLQRAGDSGLAWWLRAKLALRDGDQSAAAAAYAKAARAFPAEEDWGMQTRQGGSNDDDAYYEYEQLSPHFRIAGEHAILALNHGDYLDAFELLYQSGDIYWPDTAVLAERVLTLAELKKYVDAHVPAATDAALDDPNPDVLPVAARLRELLGRRLLRAGQWQAAPAYFASKELRQAASEYAQARTQAERRWTRIGQAEAYYRAARLARWQGMELLGSEMAPDYRIYDGNFSLGEDPTRAGPWVSAGEAERQVQSKVEPDRRYHYRYLATALAEQAADRVPTSSQAFAALLCKGGGWIESRDFATTQRLYQRYVAQGAMVPWGFGRNCPEPDFAAASKRLWSERWAYLWQQKGLLLAAGSSLILLAVTGLWYRRRRRLP